MNLFMEGGWGIVSTMNVYRIGSTAWKVARALAGKFQTDNGLFLASGLAFSLLLYLIPLALIMISVLGYTVLESQEAMDKVQSVIRQFSPRSEQTLGDTVAAIGNDRGLLGIIGFISFLLLSTMVFGSTRHVLNTIFQASPGRSRSLLQGAAHDLLMMVFCVVLLFVITSLATVTGVMGNLGDMFPSATPWWGQGLRLFRRVAEVIVVGSLILGLYRFSPVKTLQFRSLMVGTSVAVVLFGLAKQVFAWYAAFAQASIPLYGALGAFLLFFLWLFYASLVFVVGAEAGWVFEHRRTLEGAGEQGMT
jgi:membrane protein